MILCWLTADKNLFEVFHNTYNSCENKSPKFSGTIPGIGYLLANTTPQM